jgi:hypothetical protein
MIEYLELHAVDFEETKRFYSEVFDWKFTDYGPEYMTFHDGRIEIGFAKGAVAATNVLVVVFADDLVAAEARVKAAGGKITQETFAFPGGSRFQFTDPSGNELSFWHDA